MSESFRTPKQLQRRDFSWNQKGVVVTYMGKRIFIPLYVVEQIISQSLAECGMPAGASAVGGCASVGGLFGKLRKSVSRARVVPKFARKALSGSLARGLASAADKIGGVAKAVVTHPAFRAGFGAMAVAFPVLAPAAVGLEVAARVIKKVEDGQKAAQQIVRGVNSVANRQKVLDAAKAQRAIARTVDAAKAGNPYAQRAAGGIIAAKVASRATKRHQYRFGLPGMF
jgi:hypothetical protein